MATVLSLPSLNFIPCPRFLYNPIVTFDIDEIESSHDTSLDGAEILSALLSIRQTLVGYHFTNDTEYSIHKQAMLSVSC